MCDSMPYDCDCESAHGETCKNRVKLSGHIGSTGQSTGPHLSVRPGEYVRKGQRLGTVGSEGNSTGLHIQFEMPSSDARPPAA